MKISYVYNHVNKLTREIFYVGIGSDGHKKKRANSSCNRNKYWKEYVEKNNGFDVIIFADDLDRDDACRIEIEQIKLMGKVANNTGILTNLSDGGEKVFLGVPRTMEQYQKIAAKLKGKKLTEAHKVKLRNAKLGKKLTEEHKSKISVSGKKVIHDESWNKNISIGLTGFKRGKASELHKKARRDATLKNNPFGARAKSIICLTNGRMYGSVKEAAKILNIGASNIHLVLSGKKLSVKKHRFTYA